MRVLEVQNLSVQFGDNNILEDISFDVDEGDFLLILGPNGAGKSVLIKTLLGINRQYAGDFLFFNKSIDAVRDWIAYVPQYVDFDQTFPLTVSEVVRMGLIGVKFRYANKRIRAALGQVKMEKLGDRYFGDLSGGQKKRVLIARALVRKPKLLIMDEPLAGIDVIGEEGFYDLLKKWHKQMGLTTMMISHDISLVHKIATKVLCLNVKRVCFNQADKISEQSFDKLFGKEIRFHRH